MPIVKTKHLLEANHRAAERIKELEAERDKAVELLREFIPDSECDLCYPCYCWPHGYSTPCPVGQARAFLASIDGEVK